MPIVNQHWRMHSWQFWQQRPDGLYDHRRRRESSSPTREGMRPGEIWISYQTHAHVKDHVHCDERGHIEVKGISRPVATYQVIDLYENLGEVNLVIRSKLPHFQLDIDVTLVSESEQREATAVLLDAVERLSNTTAKA